MRPAPLVPYLTGVCLAATTVVALDVGMAARPTTVVWPRSGVVVVPAQPTPSASSPERLRSGADLPAGPAFPQHGEGTWRVVRGSSGAAATTTAPGTPYTVEVEDGVTLPHGDDTFAAVVDYALRHPRGWAGRQAFRRVDGSVDPQLRIRLTSQQTTRARCGFELPYDTSCRIGSSVYLSAARWFRGAHAYVGDLRRYRLYTINHEVGHFLGLGHEVCPADGAPAPVMMQQTLSTANDELASITAGSDQGVAVAPDGKTCAPNPWPSG